MTKNAVLVFLPMSGIGDFLPMVNVAKRLMDLNSNLFTAVLFMDEDEGLNQTVSAEFDSVSGRTKFINLPPPPLVDHKDTPLVERAVNLAKAMKPSIIEAVTNIVRDSTSPQLAGFVLDKFYTPLTNDLANEFRVPTYLFYTSNAAALGMDLYMQALHDDDDQKLNLAELQDSEIDEFNRLSSLPPIPYEFFPPALQNLDIFHRIHIHRMKNHSKEVKGTAESEIDEFNRLSSLPPIPYELFPSSLLNLDIFRKIHIHRMNNHSKEVKGTTESEITFNIKEVKGKAESEIEPYSLSPTPYDFSPPVLQNLENFHKIHRMKNHSKEVKGKAESEIEFNISVGPVPHNILQNLETFDKIDRIKNPLKEVKGIMVNTFLELETNTVNSLSDGKLPPVYPVGPILNLKSSSEVDQKYADIMEWLDGQPASSVVLFCFGSMGSFNEDQVKEIACGLEQSGHRFLWSLRRPPVEDAILRLAGPTDYEDVASVLPEGFLDRTLGIGKIIGWAPQVAILDHPAIGGFVSNCGWNSVLESIWFGVPTATWPIYAEQYMNAFQIVKELGIGVEITMDYRKEVWPMGGDHKEPEIVNAIKIERGIRRLMEQNTEVRKRVKEMSDKSRKVLMEGGSSYSNLCRFINDVMDNMA